MTPGQKNLEHVACSAGCAKTISSPYDVLTSSFASVVHPPVDQFLIHGIWFLAKQSYLWLLLGHQKKIEMERAEVLTLWAVHDVQLFGIHAGYHRPHPSEYIVEVPIAARGFSNHSYRAIDWIIDRWVVVHTLHLQSFVVGHLDFCLILLWSIWCKHVIVYLDLHWASQVLSKRRLDRT